MVIQGGLLSFLLRKRKAEIRSKKRKKSFEFCIKPAFSIRLFDTKKLLSIFSMNSNLLLSFYQK